MCALCTRVGMKCLEKCRNPSAINPFCNEMTMKRRCTWHCKIILFLFTSMTKWLSRNALSYPTCSMPCSSINIEYLQTQSVYAFDSESEHKNNWLHIMQYIGGNVHQHQTDISMSRSAQHTRHFRSNAIFAFCAKWKCFFFFF